MKEIQVLEDVMWMEDLVELRKLHTVAGECCANETANQFMLQIWLKNWKQYFLWKTIYSEK